ncbi:MAG: hypothetical protein RDU30_14885 [Desulfovibrionaceae bacterium]|nr:hypothetical protein [Desulfovibrionaceae bacterium]
MDSLLACIVWCVFLMMAVALGALRDRVVAPRLGMDRARRVMTLVLCLFIFLVTWLLVVSWENATVWKAIGVGVGWTVATCIFECVMGRVVMKLPWSEILADYHLFRGRLWPLVLMSTLTAPVLCLIATTRFLR